jgi:hypothetical protein
MGTRELPGGLTPSLGAFRVHRLLLVCITKGVEKLCYLTKPRRSRISSGKPGVAQKGVLARVLPSQEGILICAIRIQREGELAGVIRAVAAATARRPGIAIARKALTEVQCFGVP